MTQIGKILPILLFVSGEFSQRMTGTIREGNLKENEDRAKREALKIARIEFGMEQNIDKLGRKRFDLVFRRILILSLDSRWLKRRKAFL